MSDVLSMLKSAGRPPRRIYEQYAATIFSDLTVNADAPLAHGVLPHRVHLSVRGRSGHRHFRPRCLPRSTDDPVMLNTIGAIASLLMLSLAIVSFFIVSLPIASFFIASLRM
jgi:hypothetical protein